MAGNQQPPASTSSTDWKKTSFIDRARLRPGDDNDIEVVRKSSKYIRRIVLIRHGQSEGNVNKKMLSTVADHAIPLSEKGMEEMRECAKKLKEYFEKTYGDDPDFYPPIRLWTSPYKRTRQSAQILFDVCAEYFTDQREHILLGEQQFGLFEGVTAAEVAQLYPVESSHFKKLLDHHGRFWARPPLGESRFDVAKRVHQSFSTFQADAKRHNIRDIVVVTHGITFRAFFMMWLQQTPEWFENEPNPGNGCIRIIEDDRDQGVLFAGFDDYAPGAGFTGPVGSVPAPSSHPQAHQDQSSIQSSTSSTASSTTTVILDNTSSNEADGSESDDSQSDESIFGGVVPLGTPPTSIGTATAAASSSSLSTSGEPSSASSLGDGHVHFALPNSPGTATPTSGSPITTDLPVRTVSPQKPIPVHPLHVIQTHPPGHPSTRILNNSDAPIAKFQPKNSSSASSSSSSQPTSTLTNPHTANTRSAMKGARQTKRHLARTLGSSDGSYNTSSHLHHYLSGSEEVDGGVASESSRSASPVIDLKQSIENLRFRN